MDGNHRTIGVVSVMRPPGGNSCPPSHAEEEIERVEAINVERDAVVFGEHQFIEL